MTNRKRKNFALLNMLLIYNLCCNGQHLTMKNNRCSTKTPSSQRMNSLFIMEYIHKLLHGISTLKECYTICHGEINCAYFAYHKQMENCLQFHSKAPDEAISRLLQEKWTFGRTKQANGRLLVYVEKTSCTETYCQNTCLKDIQEQCFGPFRGSDCNLYTGVIDSCKADISSIKLEGGGTQPSATIINGEYYNVKVEGIVAKMFCGDYEYSRITTKNGLYCLAIIDDACNHEETHWRPVVYKYITSAHCRGSSSIFGFNWKDGTIIHACTGHQVCFHEVKHNSWLLIKPTCPGNTITGRWTRNIFGVLQYQTSHCVKTSEVSDGSILYDQDSCHDTIFAFTFPTLARGPIKTKFYQDDTPFARTFGRADNFEFHMGIQLETYNVIAETYFVPKQAGRYKFVVIVNWWLKLYLSSNDQAAGANQILHKYSTGYGEWSSPSDERSLQAGRKYYMRMHGYDQLGGDYFLIGMYLPNSNTPVLVTHEYLADLE